MMKYIGNAFSPAMLRSDTTLHLTITPISERQYRRVAKHAKSVIGHPELSEYFDLPLNRETVHLKKGDMLYVALPKKRHKEHETVHYGDTETFDVEQMEFVYRQIQVLDK